MEMEQPESFLARAYDPILQGLFALGGAILLMLIGQLVLWSGALEVTARFPWMAIGALMLFYALFNSIFSLSSKDPTKYWGRSLMSFIGLTAIGGTAAWLFSGLSIWEAGSFRWIFVVITLGYLVFLSLVNLMKRIVEFAMKEEWSHPRTRNRKNRKTP